MEEKKFKFYIAHRIVERKEVKNTVIPKLQKIGIETVNPFYNPDGNYKKERPEIKRIDDGKMDPYTIKTKQQAQRIVDSDLALIDGCDGTLAFIRVASIGTSMEVIYTSLVCKKPVFVITETFPKHAWLMRFATKIFKNEDQFCRYWEKNKTKWMENK